MIYLFSWNSSYLISNAVSKWKSAFEEKYGVENIIHIKELSQLPAAEINEYISARSLFSEKRLLIIDWFPYSGEKSFSWAAEMESTILESIKNISDELIIVFSSLNPDKRKSGYKTLSKLAEVKDFQIQNEDQSFLILEKKYQWKIEHNAMRKIIALKGNNLQKCIHEIDKILILKSTVTLKDIQNHITPEFEESIFVFIDTLLTKNSQKIFSEFRNILWYSNIYAVYQSILTNIRVFLYIELLKHQKKSSLEISDILKLWNRAFLINKSHKSTFKDLQELYKNLLGFDKNMKFWKLISSDEKYLSEEIEKIFLKFIN